ncbi:MULTISPECIES: hypothetical protein [Streptomyces]|uniref:hypothetical protein n=1 Tax=Streptomyces TaxID=1883 RepID=UPI0006898D25|nr:MULTISPECIES: hypothetical protein [Streptomyces]
MPILYEFRTEARPDNGLIEVYDSDAYLTDSEAVRQNRDTVVAGTGAQIYLHSLQGIAPAEILVRVWDGPTPADSTRVAEGERSTVLDSPTGEVVIRAFAPDLAGHFQLPRPGVYEGRVSWKGRHEAAAQEASLHAELGAAELQWPTDTDAIWATHQEVLETYRIDLWWTAESEDDEDDEY